MGFDNLSPPESDAAGDGVTHLRELPMGKGDKAPQKSWVRNPALPGLPLALHRALAAPGMVSCGSWTHRRASGLDALMEELALCAVLRAAWLVSAAQTGPFLPAGG